MLPSGSKENVGNNKSGYYLRERPPLAPQATACKSPVKKTFCSCKGSCCSRICGCVKKSNKCGPPCKCDSKICQNQVEALESQMREMPSLMFDTEAKKSEKESELNDTKNISIHILNDDCLRHVFLFLPIIDRVRIEIVCKRWRDLSQDSWYMIKTLDVSRDVEDTWGLTNISSLDLALLRKILLKCGRFLTRLILSYRIVLDSLDQSTLIIVIGELCPNLTSIDVHYGVCKSSDIRTLANYYRNLTKFSLRWSVVECDDELKCLFKRNQNLEYLEITAYFLLGKCLLGLPEQTMRTIILEDCNVLQDTHLSMALKKLKNLKHLAIIKCPGISEHILEVVGQHCKSLRTLKLDGHFPFIQTADMLYLIHLVNLQVLKITYNLKVSDDFLTDLVQHCQQLTNVDITGCYNVSDVGLTAIATLVRLEKLKVSYMHQITDEGLKNVCGLKELECRRCRLFSDRGMTTLIQSSPELQLLDLSGCRNIKDPILEVAKDVCSSRTNNVMLKMIVGGTAILTKKKIGQERLPPLLKIYDIDLSSPALSSLRGLL